MYTLIISILAGLLAGWFFTNDMNSPGWGVICGVAALFITQMLIALFIRIKSGKIQKEIETVMQDAQAKANRMMVQFERRPPGSLKVAQQQLEKVQTDAVRKTLELCGKYTPFYKWNLMLPRQINAMKVQLHFQLREFGKVDELPKKSLLLDVRTKLIKLVRLYKKEDPALDKFYKSKLTRIKGEDGAFAACVYAWMKVRQEKYDDAVAALVQAKKLSDNAVLLENYDKLANGKYKQFSNAGFGDLWYSLYLEEPKIKMQRQQQRMF
jgi:hypothetical protein